jgi:hypothetical protein
MPCQASSPWVHLWNEGPLHVLHPRISSRHQSHTWQFNGLTWLNQQGVIQQFMVWEIFGKVSCRLQNLWCALGPLARLSTFATSDPSARPSCCNERGTTPTALQTENRPPQLEPEKKKQLRNLKQEKHRKHDAHLPAASNHLTTMQNRQIGDSYTYRFDLALCSSFGGRVAKLRTCFAWGIWERLVKVTEKPPTQATVESKPWFHLSSQKSFNSKSHQKVTQRISKTINSHGFAIYVHL